MDFTDPVWEVVPESIRQHLPKRSEEYALRILAEYSPEPVEVPAPPAPKAVKAPSRRGANLSAGDRHDPQKHDYQKIADMWSSGMTGKEIAAELRCSPTTVTIALKKIQPPGYTGKSGRRPLEKCKHDHDLSVHGRPASNGGRYCAECKRIRERVRPDRDRVR